MDDPKVNKLYLVLEYMKGGDLMQIQQGDSKSYSCQAMVRRGVGRYLRIGRVVAIALAPSHWMPSLTTASDRQLPPPTLERQPGVARA